MRNHSVATKKSSYGEVPIGGDQGKLTFKEPSPDELQAYRALLHKRQKAEQTRTTHLLLAAFALTCTFVYFAFF